jgi:3'5'-cyclic nucleotide phosphodiesterase
LTLNLVWAAFPAFQSPTHPSDLFSVTTVPNSVLVAEQTPLAITYKNKSVAEQNSLALALGLLEDKEFRDLYSTICPSHAEKGQLRHLVINTVMATDIVSIRMTGLGADLT